MKKCIIAVSNWCSGRKLNNTRKTKLVNTHFYCRARNNQIYF